MAGIVSDQTFESDEGAYGEALASGQISAELLRKKLSGGDDRVRAANAIQYQIAKTRAHRIPHYQRAREHTDRRCHAQHNRQVRAPVVRQAAANQRGRAHQ